MKTWKDLSKADKIVICVFVAMFLTISAGLIQKQKNITPTINKTFLQKTR